MASTTRVIVLLAALQLGFGFRASSKDAGAAVDMKDCLSIPGYPGQCMLSTSQGACYIQPGVPSEENASMDVRWACWSPTDPKLSDAECIDKQTPSGKKVGYEGACVYTEYGKTKTDDEITACESLPYYHTQCNPVSEKWGACYVAGEELQTTGWMCVPDGNPDIDALRKGDCKTRVVADNETKAYTDVCVFKNRKQKRFKCDTVNTYVASKCNADGSAGAEGKGFGACFSQEPGIEWLCYTNDTLLLHNCETTPMSEEHGGALNHWSGGCIFPGNDGYDDAETYVTTTSTAATTTVTTGTGTTTAKSAAWRSWGILPLTSLLVVIGMLVSC